MRLFQDDYLSVAHNGAAPIDYPYSYVAPVNTGVPSGLDLDNSGSVGGPNDAFGFGFFPGQYGMVVYSKYPIDQAAVRTTCTTMRGNAADSAPARRSSSPATRTPTRKTVTPFLVRHNNFSTPPA